MAPACDHHRRASQYAELACEDRFGLLVDTEWTAREPRRLTQRVRNARLRYPASLEEVDVSTPRGVNRDVIVSLGPGAWIREHHHVLMTGPTGIGTSWWASAFVQRACRHGFTGTYVRAPRLMHDLAVSRGDGSEARLLATHATLDRLAIDDGLLAPLTDAERRDLLEVIDDRRERTATRMASQLPPTAWHAAIGEPSVAEAIGDRLIPHAHRLTLKGPTRRDPGTRRGTKATSGAPSSAARVWRNAMGRLSMRSSFLGHPRRSSIDGRACGPCPSCGQRTRRVSHTLGGRRTTRAAHNGPQALSWFTNEEHMRTRTRLVRGGSA
jgi:DNA replication protein DnaC